MKRDYRNPKATADFNEFIKNPALIPFSFGYGGVRYEGFSPSDFKLKNSSFSENGGKQTHVLEFDLAGELKITLIAAHYPSHGASDYTVWFENLSDKNSKVIENPRLEVEFFGKNPVLRGIYGDHVNQYAPYSASLKNGLIEFTSDLGRATHVNFPYFNLEYGDGGVMLAIGWAGSWTARFDSRGEKTKYTAYSVNGMKTYLKPHEKIRTALFALAPYLERDEVYATNYWRDWFVEHNMPKADANGTPLQTFSTCYLPYDTGRPNSDGSISETYKTWRPSLEKILAEGLKFDFRWFDAGWYAAPDGTSTLPFVKGHDWWDTVGSWEIDPVKWPGGTFRQSTDFAREHGMKTLVWFESERVTDPDSLVKYHGYDSSWAIYFDGAWSISNDIGNPDCLRWTTARICKFLKENKVELYREDNNSNPAPLWEYLDECEGDGRKGISECKFIGAHYKLWDDIIACTTSYGGCAFVDSCASGGGRNDLESMRRGVPLLRSDSDRASIALRLSMTTAFNKWIPFCGCNATEKKFEGDHIGVRDTYVWRASYLPALNIDGYFVHAEPCEFDSLRFGLGEWKRVAPFLLKEFYVLTPWRKKENVCDFTAYCFFNPETQEGVLLAFRQEGMALGFKNEENREKSLTLALPFVEEGEDYELTDEDSGEKLLTNDGRFTLSFAKPRTAKLLWVKKA